MDGAGDVEKTLNEADAPVEVSQWQRHCIYRVPACIKDLNPKAYRPQVVSLGPFHHGNAELLPMEEHKRRALRHLLRRADRPLKEFRAAMQDAAEQLESAYLDLGAEWRGGEGGNERFLEMLIVDGCFLLEVMRVAVVAGHHDGDYALNDPIFSRHGVLYMVPYIRRDMLMLENQLPLLVFETLVAVETAMPQNHEVISRMVLRFLSPSSRLPPAGVELGLHPLDVYRGSLLHGSYQGSRAVPDTADMEIIRPAVELCEAGIRFKKSRTDSLRDIRFKHGVLTMPALVLDDSTEYMLLNMMTFERLHAGAGNDIMAYVFFMSNLLDSAKDVALLGSKGIVQNAVGSDKAAAKMFESMSKDVVLEPESALDAVHLQVNAYCRSPWSMCRASLRHSNACFRTPWALFAAAVLLVMIIMQTIYAVLQFYRPGQR
ncbi:UPF0481 protein At3g47200-like [Phragmites australis]|uniref:UPF0481 protein At3g47200-like n=1 Tax=Phragmites australis TaxID=29695 RepID=UPI002D794507|nr:UPF0481 protein At3g47200-like [Phragmites australis]